VHTLRRTNIGKLSMEPATPAVEIPAGKYCTCDIQRGGCPWYYRDNDNLDTCGCPRIAGRLDEDDDGVLRSGTCCETYPHGATVRIEAKPS
jgi:hypothetical protein